MCTIAERIRQDVEKRVKKDCALALLSYLESYFAKGHPVILPKTRGFIPLSNLRNTNP